MGEFRMPALGADMERGTLIEWLIKPGDYVHRGDLVAAVETDKSVIDVETFEEGVVAELIAEVGEVLPIGAPLARITPTPAAGSATAQPAVAKHASGGAPVSRPKRPSARPAVSPPVRHFAQLAGVDLATVRGTGHGGAITHADIERAKALAAAPASEEAAAPSSPEVSAPRTRSSPRARRLAAERGIDLAGLDGTGPGGAVRADDVPTAASVAPEAPAADEPRPTAAPALPATRGAAEHTAGLRRAIGSLMARSKKTIPHYYLSSTVDMRNALAWMETVNAGRPVSARLVPAVLLLKATALAARAVPEMNGYFVDDRFEPSTSVNLGMVIALRTGGIVAPAILDTASLSLDELMERLRDLVSRTRGGRLQRAEMAEATMTVTNLGDLGVDSVFGVIYPPQVALVGFGRIEQRPWAHDGMVGVRDELTATLAADHRVSDGMRGARFLSRIDELLQEPETL